MQFLIRQKVWTFAKTFIRDYNLIKFKKILQKTWTKIIQKKLNKNEVVFKCKQGDFLKSYQCRYLGYESTYEKKCSWKLI